MIDFPAFVQGLFLVIVIALMVTTVLYFRKPSVTKSLSKDNRALLLLMIVGGIFVVSLLIGVKLFSWASNYRTAKSDFQLKQELNLDEYSFIDQTYKPLGQEYRQLHASREGLDKMVAKLNSLKPKHKNHEPLLQGMLETFSEESKLQNELYKKIKLEIRGAMIFSATTQSALAVKNQFYERAKVLHAKIVNSRKRAHKKLGDTAGLLEESLINARRDLNKKYHSKKTTKPITIYSFTQETTQSLLGYLEKYDASLRTSLNQMLKVIITTRQNKDTMNVFSQKEVELKEPFEKTMLLWSNAEIKGTQYWGHILYSIEAAYLADQFNMPHHKPAYRFLMRDLKKRIPEHLNTLVKTYREVEGSFISPNFVEKSRKH